MWRKGNLSALLAGMYIPHNHCGEEYFLKKLKRELPYDPAIPLLDVYLEKTVIWNHTCTTIFIEALLTIARTWKQPKCPSTEGWTERMWNILIYIMEYFSAIQEWNNAIYSHMEGPRDYHTEWSKSDKDKYHIISLLCEI